MTDKQILDYLNETIDEVSVVRDIKHGVNFSVCGCSSKSGCPIEANGPTIRLAIYRLYMIDKENKPNRYWEGHEREDS